MDRAADPANRAPWPVRGCAGTPRRATAPPRRSATVGRAVAAHLLRKPPDVDRFLEIAGEAGRQQMSSIAEVGARAPGDNRETRRSRALLELARDVDAIHVRELEVEQDHGRQPLGGDGDALAPTGCLDRP